MCILPVGAYVMRVHIHVTTAFNDSGTDQIKVGYTGTTEAFATLTDVSSTGVKSVTAGANVGYQTVSVPVNAYYVGQNSNATTGKAIVILEYVLCPPIPSA